MNAIDHEGQNTRLVRCRTDQSHPRQGKQFLRTQIEQDVFVRRDGFQTHVEYVAYCGIQPDDAGNIGRTGFETLRSEEHTSELQSLMRISYAVFCLKKKTKKQYNKTNIIQQ